MQDVSVLCMVLLRFRKELNQHQTKCTQNYVNEVKKGYLGTLRVCTKFHTCSETQEIYWRLCATSVCIKQ